jgi:hypothetical protein
MLDMLKEHIFKICDSACHFRPIIHNQLHFERSLVLKTPHLG